MIPDHAASDILPIFVVFQYFPLDNSSVISILQFLGNFLRSIPGEDDSSSPIIHKNVFSVAEIDLSFEWLSITVVFEIQALVVTRIMRILNFFVPNFGSPCRTRSSIFFSELNFHQE